MWKLKISVMIVLAALVCLASAYGQDVAKPPAAAEAVDKAAKPAADAAATTPAGTSTAATASSTAPAEGRGAVATLFHKVLIDGGKIVWVQLLVSCVGLAFAVERLLNLRRQNILPAGLARQADELWKAGKQDAILDLCDQNPSTLGRMIRTIVEHRDSPPGEVTTLAADVGRPELKLHLQKAHPVITVATLEPLLGLFGTVFGMIGAFDTVAMLGSMGDPSALANDISVALITTAVGLVTAIPLLALYHYFKAQTNTYAIELEATINNLVRNWLRKSPTSTPPTRSVSRDAVAGNVPGVVSGNIPSATVARPSGAV